MLLERGIMAGNKAERFTADGSQLTLGVLGLLLTPEVPKAPETPEAPASSPPSSSPSKEASSVLLRAPRRPTGRRAITAMLPRVEIEVLPPEVQREGLDAFERIGEETSEVVEHRPASLVLVRIVRPKFVRKRVARDVTPLDPDESPVLIAEPPERPIERGLAGPGLLAKTIVYRWQDHLPLYRQEKIHARDGLELARSTICGWHEQVADLAERLVEAMLRDAFTQPYLCVDATGVLFQAEEQCRRAHFWVLVAPARHVLYRYSHKHDSEAVDHLLAGYKGHLVADAHSVYDHLYRTGDIVEVGCWAHCRRYFYKALASDPARAEHALPLIRGLYRLERPVQTATRKKREEVRRLKSRPLTEALFAWCEQQAAVVLDETPIARALGYARNQRAALCRFLDDGRLLASCQLHGIEPWAYLRDLLCLLPSWPSSRVLELAPAFWQQTLQQEDTQQRLAANVFRGVSILDHAQPT